MGVWGGEEDGCAALRAEIDGGEIGVGVAGEGGGGGVGRRGGRERAEGCGEEARGVT